FDSGGKQRELRRLRYLVSKLSEEIAGSFGLGDKNDSRFCAELSAAEGHGIMELRGDFSTARGHRSWENEYRIGATHLTVKRNGLGARGRQVHQGPTGGYGARKTNGFDQRMLPEPG